jgi:hypothetical protein
MEDHHRPLMARLGPLLGVAGVSALALALLWARPYSWSQFCLLVAATFCLVIAPGFIRRSFTRLVHDREARETTLASLERRPSARVMHAVWLGCIITLLEIGLKTFEDAAGKKVLGLHYLWDAPIGYLLPLVSLGLMTAIFSKRLSPQGAMRTIVFAAVFMAFAGWSLVLLRGVHWSAAAVLAAGLAAQLARLAARQPQVVHVLARRTVLWVAAAVMVIATGALAWPRFTEARAMRALPAPSLGAPNVLLIVLDTVRAESLGLYGYERATSPHLDRFARGGVVFSRAFSTSPWTLPSHGGMFTGRLPHELTGGWVTPIDGTHRTLAEALTSAGYATAGFVANTTYCSAEFGLARGFSHYEDHRASIARSLLATSFGTAASKALSLSSRYRFWLKNAEHVNADFLHWVDARDESRPFFAFLNYYDAHAPYVAPPEYVRRFSDKAVRGDIWSRTLDEWRPEEIPGLQTAYDSTLAYLDEQVGRLFDALGQRDLLPQQHRRHHHRRSRRAVRGARTPRTRQQPVLAVVARASGHRGAEAGGALPARRVVRQSAESSGDDSSDDRSADWRISGRVAVNVLDHAGGRCPGDGHAVRGRGGSRLRGVSQQLSRAEGAHGVAVLWNAALHQE